MTAMHELLKCFFYRRTKLIEIEFDCGVMCSKSDAVPIVIRVNSLSIPVDQKRLSYPQKATRLAFVIRGLS